MNAVFTDFVGMYKLKNNISFLSHMKTEHYKVSLHSSGRAKTRESNQLIIPLSLLNSL